MAEQRQHGGACRDVDGALEGPALEAAGGSLRDLVSVPIFDRFRRVRGHESVYRDCAHPTRATVMKDVIGGKARIEVQAHACPT